MSTLLKAIAEIFGINPEMAYSKVYMFVRLKNIVIVFVESVNIMKC